MMSDKSVNPALSPELERIEHLDAREALSSLVDGELSADGLDRLWADAAEDAELTADWSRYQLIGEVMRGVQTPLRGGSHAAFFAGIESQLVPVKAPTLSLPTERFQVRGEAANAAVFRWKLVAGLASVVAVLAVGWGSLGLLGGSLGAPGGTELAKTSADAVPTAGMPSPLVVVGTEHGAVLRDPQLEALLTEHRQFGGLSALQMPAGFLRNATHDASPRR